jgi:hypothetical protein
MKLQGEELPEGGREGGNMVRQCFNDQSLWLNKYSFVFSKNYGLNSEKYY